MKVNLALFRLHEIVDCWDRPKFYEIVRWYNEHQYPEIENLEKIIEELRIEVKRLREIEAKYKELSGCLLT